MARKKAAREKVTVVLDEDDTDDDNLEPGIKGGDVERYEVKIEPPIVGGRKMKAVRSPDDPVRTNTGGEQMGTTQNPISPGKGFTMQNSASSQQIYKIEDDLRRTREVVEDMKHTVSMIDGEFKDLKAEMERVSYLLRSLEGLKNTMKDIESTVSELSGLYDMISANVNPFIDIEPMYTNGNGMMNGKKPDKVRDGKMDDEGGETGRENVFSDLSEIFDEEEELEEAEEFTGPDLLSEEWILRWTQFLIDKVGKEGLERTLDYYLDLGWIDEDVIDKVLEIARGTTSPKRKDPTKKATWRMDAEDHVKSLDFIRRIKGT